MNFRRQSGSLYGSKSFSQEANIIATPANKVYMLLFMVIVI